MTELSEISFSTNQNSNIENESYSIRCPKCYSIPKLNADFKNDIFSIKCENNHFLEYNSYISLSENTSRNLCNILCNVCKKSSSEIDIYRCNECFLFFCNKCKVKHEKINHSNFIELNKIDTYSCKNKNNEILKDISEINKEIEKVEENINRTHKFLNLFNEWLKEISNKVNNYSKTLNNYFMMQKKIVNYIKKSYENSEKNNYYNYYALTNFENFKNNNYFINNYIQTIDNTINNVYNNNNPIDKNSLLFCKILINFEKINNFSINKDINQISEYNNIKEIKDKVIKNIETKIKIENQKINEMKKINLKLSSQVKCFSPLNNNKYITIGLKTGQIDIYEIPENQNSSDGSEYFKTKLSFKIFANEIKYISELDENLLAVTDGKNIIKIIQCKNDMKEYFVADEIPINDNDNIIYSMINLPMLSQKENRHFFCIADDNHIKIYKSNKNLKNSKRIEDLDENLYENYEKNKEDININKDLKLKFELYKDIELNTLTHCLIEVSDKYIAAACNKINSIKFFDTTKDFEEVSEVKKIPLVSGSNILKVIPNKNILIAACTDGFIIICTKKLQKLKHIHCTYSVLSLEIFNDNTIICCCSSEKDNRIKQYEISDYFCFKKLSERKIYNNYEIWTIKKINERIFYLNNTNIINYLT